MWYESQLRWVTAIFVLLYVRRQKYQPKVVGLAAFQVRSLLEAELSPT